MPSIIVAHMSDGTKRRCDANCHNAKSDTCQCVCGGVNHGVGLKQASQNTNDMYEDFMRDFMADNPDVTRFDVHLQYTTEQLELHLLFHD